MSELYDYTSDPREMKNLWDNPSYQHLKQTLMYNLTEWFVLTGDITPLQTDPRGLPPWKPNLFGMESVPLNYML